MEKGVKGIAAVHRDKMPHLISACSRLKPLGVLFIFRAAGAWFPDTCRCVFDRDGNLPIHEADRFYGSEAIHLRPDAAYSSRVINGLRPARVPCTNELAHGLQLQARHAFADGTRIIGYAVLLGSVSNTTFAGTRRCF